MPVGFNQYIERFIDDGKMTRPVVMRQFIGKFFFGPASSRKIRNIVTYESVVRGLILYEVNGLMFSRGKMFLRQYGGCRV